LSELTHQEAAMSEGQVVGDQPTQLNYVVPQDVQSLLERYCDQTLISPSSLIRHLVAEFVDGSRTLEGAPFNHPQGRRTTVVLPERLLAAFEKKLDAEDFGTKAAVLAALLRAYLPPRVTDGETVRVEVNLPTSIYQKIGEIYGPGPAEALVLKALEDIADRSAQLTKEAS
jgi:hypothetical protein